MPANPVHVVKTEKLVVRSGKVPVLTDGEVRVLFQSIPARRVIDLRDWQTALGRFQGVEFVADADGVDDVAG